MLLVQTLYSSVESYSGVCVLADADAGESDVESYPGVCVLADAGESDVESYPGVCVLADAGEADVDQPAAYPVHTMNTIQYNTIQLYCLCVEKFAFWLVIYIKHSVHLTRGHQQLNETRS